MAYLWCLVVAYLWCLGPVAYLWWLVSSLPVVVRASGLSVVVVVAYLWCLVVDYLWWLGPVAYLWWLGPVAYLVATSMLVELKGN